MLVSVPRAENRLTIVEGCPLDIDDAIQDARSEFLKEVGILMGWHNNTEIAVSLRGRHGSYFYSNEANFDPATRQRMREKDMCVGLYQHLHENQTLGQALDEQMSHYKAEESSELLTNAWALKVLEHTYNKIAPRNQKRIAIAQCLRRPVSHIIGYSQTFGTYLEEGPHDVMIDAERGQRLGMKIMVAPPLSTVVASEYACTDDGRVVFGKRAELDESVEAGRQMGYEFFRVTDALSGLARAIGAIPRLPQATEFFEVAIGYDLGSRELD